MVVMRNIFLVLAVVLAGILVYIAQIALWNVSEVDIPEYRAFLALGFTLVPLCYVSVRRWVVKDISTFWLPQLMFVGMFWALHIVMSCVQDSGLMLEIDTSIVAVALMLLSLVVLTTKFKTSIATKKQCIPLVWQWWLLAPLASLLYHFAPLFAFAAVPNMGFVVVTQWSIVLMILGAGWWFHSRALKKSVSAPVSE